MFQILSTYCLYAAAFAPLFLVKASFFPFIAYKALFFRMSVGLAALFFLIHLLSSLRNQEYIKKLVTRLKHPILVSAMVFAGAMTLAAALGVNPTQAFWSNFERGDGAFQLVHYVAFLVLCALTLTDRKRLERMLIVNIFVSVPVCLYALLQLTITDVNNWFVIAAGARVSGTLGNPSYLAAYLMFILSFILYFVLQKKNQWRITLSAIGIFELFILLKTGTRGAFLGLLAAVIVFVITTASRSESKKVKHWMLGTLAAIAALIVVFFATHQAAVWNNVPVLNRLVNLNSAINDIKPRLWSWGTALSGFAERPIAGWGAESFGVPFDKYYNPNHFGIESFFDRTHNIFLQYAIDGGLIVLIPWLAMFYFYYRRLARRKKDHWHTILFVLPIAYLTQGFFLFDTLPIYLGLFVLFTLVINTEHELPEEEVVPDGSLPGINKATATLLIVGFMSFGYFTLWLPAKKNQALVTALSLQNSFMGQISAREPITITPLDIMQAFEQALEQQSPIGQEETIGMYQKFVLNLVEMASQSAEAQKNPQFILELGKLIARTNELFDANTGIFPGLKQQYINGGINLRYGLSFNQRPFLERGKRLYTEALTIAPKRLEFIRVLMEVARVENDAAALTRWQSKAHEYRPDLFQKPTAN